MIGYGPTHSMAIPHVIVIDRSILAVNMFHLLLAPFDVGLIAVKRFEEARPHFFRRERVDLAIINSNSFGKKFTEYLNHFCDDKPVAKVPKIFLCRDVQSEADWREVLTNVPHATVVVRPFHPLAFGDLVANIFTAGGKK